jgi:hypothetical protein
MSASSVNRREALRRLAIGGAGMATLPTWVESLNALAFEHGHLQKKATGAAAAAWKPKVFTPHQNQTVITLTELIIPQTDTPGAKAAKVNEFIDTVLADAKQDEREKFLAGLTWIDDRAKRDTGKTFVDATADQQTALLTLLSNAADAKNAAAQAAAQPKVEGQQSQAGAREEGKREAPVAPVEDAGRDFFTAIKSMTITGYYTSEIGMRQELGDDGTLFFAEFKGCTHPEHQVQA